MPAFLVGQGCPSLTVPRINSPPTADARPDLETKPGDFTFVVGQEGGTITLTDAASPLNGATLDIPADALPKDTEITVTTLLSQALEQQLGPLPEGFIFWGGICLDGAGTSLNKPVQITLPNPQGAQATDQLLVGEVVSLPGIATPLFVYRGQAHAGSPITFTVPGVGSFAITSASDPFAIVKGTFVDTLGNPMSEAAITSSFSRPFVAWTGSDGRFELPAGPAGSRPAIMGVRPLNDEGIAGLGIQGIPIPDAPPSSLTDLVVRLVAGAFDLPEPPSGCACDPCPVAPPVFLSPGQTGPSFQVCPGESIQIHLAGLANVFVPGMQTVFVPGAQIPNVIDLAMALWSGSLCLVTQVTFSTDDPAVATFQRTPEANSGLLKGVSSGTTTLRGTVSILCLKPCFPFAAACPCYLTAAPAEVVVPRFPCSCQQLVEVLLAKQDEQMAVAAELMELRSNPEVDPERWGLLVRQVQRMQCCEMAPIAQKMLEQGCAVSDPKTLAWAQQILTVMDSTCVSP
ncbi:MAG TPA: hypothetical protein P5159_23850 [Phycisphaerae bacterium]|nr:hypothetical protein [Phycisphaerae bacterium]